MKQDAEVLLMLRERAKGRTQNKLPCTCGHERAHGAGV